MQNYKINTKLRNHHITKISPVQLILPEWKIISVCYQNFSCLVDFVKLRNQFSLLSEFLLFSGFCEIAKSVQFAIRISNVLLILQNCEIRSIHYHNFSCSVDFGKFAKSVQYMIRICNCKISLVYWHVSNRARGLSPGVHGLLLPTSDCPPHVLHIHAYCPYG